MTTSRRSVLLFTLAALAAGGTAHADRDPDRRPRGEPPGRGAPPGRGNGSRGEREISLNQAIAMVERRFKARVVRSDVRQEGGRRIYVLRLLDDGGNAQVVRVDASSGAIL